MGRIEEVVRVVLGLLLAHRPLRRRFITLRSPTFTSSVRLLDYNLSYNYIGSWKRRMQNNRCGGR